MLAFFKKLFVIVAVFLSIHAVVYSAEINFEGEDLVGVGGEMSVGVVLDTKTASINAIEGEIAIPEKYFEVEKITDGESLIDFWIDSPYISNGVLKFSGVIPGGIIADDILLFKVILKGVSEGADVLGERGEVKVFINDGKGTNSKALINKKTITVSSTKEISFVNLQDTTAPEEFSVRVLRDKDIFGGEPFAIFMAQDKGVGIDYYEVQENSSGEIDEELWEVTKSPYKLKDKNGNGFVFVKAVDKAGNVRTSSYIGGKSHSGFYLYLFFAIVLLALAYLVRKKKLWHND